MLHGLVWIWFSVVLLTVCPRGYAQTIGPQMRLDRDYFTALGGTPDEAHELKKLERHRLREALFYIRQGKPRDALRDCIYVLRHFVNHPKGFAILGIVAKLIKEPLLPIPYFERALQFYPIHAMTHAQYGKYLAEIGKIDDGVKRLSRAIEIDPKLKVSYTWLARIYVQHGKTDLARQILQRGKKEEELAPLLISPEINDTAESTNLQQQGQNENDRGMMTDDENKTEYAPFRILPEDQSSPEKKDETSEGNHHN